MTDFFDNKEEGNATGEGMIKIGDQEFSMEEAQEFINLGKQTKDIETKYNTKMDRVYPEFIKTTQELKEAKEYKEKFTALEQQIEQQKLGSQGLSEQQISEAREQLYAIMGGKPLTDKDADAWYQQRRQQEKLMESIDTGVTSLLADVRKDGKPEVSREELLSFMGENNISKADIAYKIMKEKELDDWRMDKLSKGKKSGLFTISNSQAGSKQPVDVRPNSQNLEAMVSEALSGNPEY